MAGALDVVDPGIADHYGFLGSHSGAVQGHGEDARIWFRDARFLRDHQNVDVAIKAAVAHLRLLLFQQVVRNDDDLRVAADGLQ